MNWKCTLDLLLLSNNIQLRFTNSLMQQWLTYNTTDEWRHDIKYPQRARQVQIHCKASQLVGRIIYYFSTNCPQTPQLLIAINSSSGDNW